MPRLLPDRQVRLIASSSTISVDRSWTAPPLTPITFLCHRSSSATRYTHPTPATSPDSTSRRQQRLQSTPDLPHAFHQHSYLSSTPRARKHGQPGANQLPRRLFVLRRPPSRPPIQANANRQRHPRHKLRLSRQQRLRMGNHAHARRRARQSLRRYVPTTLPYQNSLPPHSPPPKLTRKRNRRYLPRPPNIPPDLPPPPPDPHLHHPDLPPKHLRPALRSRLHLHFTPARRRRVRLRESLRALESRADA